jgi:ribose-phosphate pyrophosphokinase
MKFFVLKGAEALGQRVAETGSFPIAPHEERDFADGEHKSRPLLDVCGEDVFVLHCLHGGPDASTNDRLIRLLFFLATCRENGAARVFAVAPYLPYSRKDRQTRPFDPVTTRYVAQLFEATGIDGIMTLDVHNLMAFQNAFRCQSLHLPTDLLFAQHIAACAGAEPLAIVSPYPGGVKRAQLVRERLAEITRRDVAFGLMEKRRSAGVVSGSLFAGDVEGRSVHIVDDMICGGGTILRAAETVKARGAAHVHAVATHGLFNDTAIADFAASETIDSVTVTDSVVPCSARADWLGKKLQVISCASLITAAIYRQWKPRCQINAPLKAPA